ncbi:MAG: hypothetical protein ACOYN6_05150 [Ignavibacteria bacterium]
MKNASKKSKTDYLLETIKPKEFMNFERYLVSKLGRSHNIDYFNYWVWKKETMISNRSSSPETNNRYNKTLSRKFLSDFNKLIEGYFIGVSVERDKQLINILMLNEMRKRNVDKLFGDYLKKAKDLNEEKLLKGLISNLTSLRYYFEEFILLNALNDEMGMVRVGGDICRMSEVVYFQNVLFNYINENLFAADTYKPYLKVDVVLKKIKEESTEYKKNHHNVYLLYRIAVLIREYKTIDDLAEVLSYLYKNEKLFTPEYLKIAFESLFRFAIFKLNYCNSDELHKAFNIIKTTERKGIIGKIPYLQPLVFFSMVNLSMSIGEISFAEKIMSIYSNKLFCLPEDDVLSICKAMLYSERGKFREAKELLKKLRVRNPTLYICSKITLLKVLYEKNELRSIMSLSDTVKHFIQRKEDINEQFKQNVHNFLSNVTNLALAKRKNGRGLLQVRERFDLECSFFQKRWVANKLAELEKIYAK